jgi:alginate O-acetyltransferase complex protein AlgI
MKVRNTFIIFLVSGFWHGANWTFIIWGLLNALYIMPSILFKTNRNNLDIVAQGRNLPSVREAFLMLLTFSLTVFAWMFFRSESVGAAFTFIAETFNSSLFTVPTIMPKQLLLLLVIFLMIEWFGRENQHALQTFGAKWPSVLRIPAYYVMIFAIYYYAGPEQAFIYFQF